MKKQNKKLTLNKRTITNLNNVTGGFAEAEGSLFGSCEGKKFRGVTGALQEIQRLKKSNGYCTGYRGDNYDSRRDICWDFDDLVNLFQRE